MLARPIFASHFGARLVANDWRRDAAQTLRAALERMLSPVYKRPTILRQLAVWRTGLSEQSPKPCKKWL
jgi:hypothetical protein